MEVGRSLVRKYLHLEERTEEMKPNPCPVSYPHLPHDYCDGKPDAPGFGTAMKITGHGPYQLDPVPTSGESEPIVWADDATPFTGKQVADLLRENTKLRNALESLWHDEHDYGNGTDEQRWQEYLQSVLKG